MFQLFILSNYYYLSKFISSNLYYQLCIDIHLILMHVNYIFSDFQYIYVTAVYADNRNRRSNNNVIYAVM